MKQSGYENKVTSYLYKAQEGYYDDKIWAIIYLACAIVWALLNIADALREKNNG